MTEAEVPFARGPGAVPGPMPDLGVLYQAVRDRAIETQRRLEGLAESATDPKGVVTVTTTLNGEIRDLKFMSRKYRDMAPAELADVLLKTIAAARERVQKRAVDEFADSNGTPSLSLFGGQVPVADLLGHKTDLAS